MTGELILRCEATLEGMLTAIYEAFVYKKQYEVYQDNIAISIGEGDTLSLFAQTVEVETDSDKAAKTAETIQKRLGFVSYHTVLSVLCHYDEERATIVLGYLVRAFSMGNVAWDCLADPYVMRMLEMNRKVGNETERFMGFLRFQDVGRFLFAEIEPKCDVIPVMQEHFEDRYPNENFMIYDSKRKYALVHPAYHRGFFVTGEDIFERLADEEWQPIAMVDEYESLWKTYFTTIAIEARENERCQNTLVPKWYRKHMNEFV